LSKRQTTTSGYAHLLEKLNGKTPPWDRRSKNAATPSETFFESDEWVGLTQCVPSPSIGVEQRHFRLTPRADAANSRLHPSPKEAGAIAVIDLVKHPDSRWQVLHAEVSPTHRRQGIATLLYDKVEAILDTRLVRVAV
jgi:ribosomal protein S18 acetylase RimI-like enzyme